MGEKVSRGGENRAKGKGWRVNKSLTFEKENAEQQLLQSI